MWNYLQWSIIRSIFREHLGLIAVAVLGSVSFLLGSWGLWHVYAVPPTYIIPHTPELFLDKNAEESSTRTAVTVDVSGAVVHPGIYELSDGSRIQDAVLMAGGFQENARLSYIHTELNLAKKLIDQQKIYIPFDGEEKPLAISNREDQASSSINTASREEILAWPGIGEKKVESILAGRPYPSLEDFLERSGVSASFMRDMQEKGMEITL